ncbi:hypothetical protein ASJ79_29420 [Mycobacterium sp. NAZ190054]|nr:hypothetical protein ASJ79_29420 [Mycobacterium sp. NAZ190054]
MRLFSQSTTTAPTPWRARCAIEDGAHAAGVAGAARVQMGVSVDERGEGLRDRRRLSLGTHGPHSRVNLK